MDVFHRLLEGIERFLYTVDEWLRFRAGERRRSTASRRRWARVWFFVNYVIRFLVTLMIEPQINPIKHFPVVTVSHKAAAAADPLDPQSTARAAGQRLGLAHRAVHPVPVSRHVRLFGVGAEGELAAVCGQSPAESAARGDRPSRRNDGPVSATRLSLGHDSQALCPAAQGQPQGLLDGQLEGLQQTAGQALHHASESIRRFIDRELLEILHESRTWADRSIAHRARSTWAATAF